MCNRTDLDLPDVSLSWLMHFWTSQPGLIGLLLSWTPLASGRTHQWVALSGMDFPATGSISRMDPGCWIPHNTPPPATISGWRLRLTGPGHKKKVIGWPSTAMNRTGEISDLVTSCCLDTMVQYSTWIQHSTREIRRYRLGLAFVVYTSVYIIHRTIDFLTHG